MKLPVFQVRIDCLTYNHSSYIIDAMNGFCMQKTSFPYICTILDDASTDGEQAVIDKYIEDYFILFDIIECKKETEDYRQVFARHKTNVNCYFRVIFLKYNHYQANKRKQHYFDEIKNVKYVAVCEGDDYWIDSNKLQKQFEYLERHEDVGMVHAKAKIFNQETQCFRGVCGEQNGDFLQILLKNPIVTLTVCYRSYLSLHYEKEKAEWNVKGWRMGDYPMWIWISKMTTIHFIDEEVAVYREHSSSLTHSTLLADRLAFIDSTTNIRLFFANLFDQPDHVKSLIKYNGNLSKMITCFVWKDKKQADIYLKELPLKDRLFYRLKYLFR